MHARFADCDPASDEDQIKTLTLESRIGEFKQNPHNMAILNAMLDEVVNCAEREANRLALEQQKSSSSSSSQQGKEKRPNFKNGKVVNRARGFVVRIFDAICNCANNNAAAATTRFKLRSNTGGGGGSGTGGASGGVGNGEREREPETLALSKKKSSSADGKKKSKGVSMAEDVEAGVRLVD
ncbi:uncharacterized protein [Drosophila tropicalis]|uniref:uncharacterized protein isoform X3 n=1 Tax=Drosophila tropicalis TaxID=46794 RepID=UPI0035ABD714